MSWLLAGIVWIVYGALGVGGIQKIHEKYKGKYWTDRYKRDCGVAWIILGVAWVALYVVFRFAPVTLAWWYRALAGVVCSIPALVYAVLVDRKYKAMLQTE